MDPISFRARFVGWLTVLGFAYVGLLFFLPYSILINIASALVAVGFAGAYYALLKTDPTIPDEKPEAWKFSMWCWIVLAGFQILPLFAEAT